MNTNTETTRTRTPAEENPWYSFMQKSIKLDGEEFPRGHHWFWELHSLHESVAKFPKINLKALQNRLPDEHWLKRIKTDENGYVPDSELDKISTNAVQTDELCTLHDYLNEIEHPRDIDFSGLIFKHEVDFLDFIFPVPVSFQDSEFHDSVKFIGTFFYSSANFSCTEFFNFAYFSHAKFCSDITFSDAVFSSDSNFHNTIFSNDSNFYNTIFSNVAVFTKAIFLHSAVFYKAEFHSGALFSDVTFSKGATFTNAIFSYRAIFDTVKITGHTDFQYAEFKDFPPSFRNVDMYSDIIWDEIKWPVLNKKSNTTTVKQNINAYEDLATHMKILNKHQNEHIFYREYMRCRGWLENHPIKFFYWLYESLADYGYGVGRAFTAWFLHMCLWAGILFFFIIGDKGTFYERFVCSVLTSASNAHSFLLSRGSQLASCYDAEKPPLAFDIAWAFGTIFGAFFLFLFILTLRVRFRLN